MKVWLLWQVTTDEYGCNDIETIYAIFNTKEKALKERDKRNEEAREYSQDYKFQVEPREVI